jgi:transcriptional regulator with XRE-family HTH domain
MFVAQEIDGQVYSNRIRRNLSRIMVERGVLGYKGLPHMSASGLYKFISGRGDITITKLQEVADDLGVGFFDLLSNVTSDQASLKN